jgi:hypothetical protein
MLKIGDKVRVKQGTLPPHISLGEVLRIYSLKESELYSAILTVSSFQNEWAELDFKNSFLYWEEKDLIPVEEWIPKVGGRVVPFQKTARDKHCSSWKEWLEMKDRPSQIFLTKNGYLEILDVEENGFYRLSAPDSCNYWYFHKNDFTQYIEPQSNTQKMERIEIFGKESLVRAFAEDVKSLGITEGTIRTTGLTHVAVFLANSVGPVAYGVYNDSGTNKEYGPQFKLPEEYVKALEEVKTWLKHLQPREIKLEIGSPKKTVTVTKNDAILYSGTLSKSNVQKLYNEAFMPKSIGWSITPKLVQIGCEDGIAVTKEEVKQVLDAFEKLNS